MLTEICQELRNWFERSKLYGTYTIVDGSLAVPGAQNGQYVRIIGSVFNDGVHKYPFTDLKDETFKGSLWLLAVPKEVEDLSKEISTWLTTNAAILTSPYQSESFGGYSYSKASSGTGGSQGNAITWQSMFGSRLNKWRKI